MTSNLFVKKLIALLSLLLACAWCGWRLANAFGGEPSSSFNSNWSVQGKRVITINSVIRVNQIEASRDHNIGNDEAHLHDAQTAERFRAAVREGAPDAKVTWAFSWLALEDQRPNYVELRKKIVEFHRLYGDEITFIPGAYFAPMYNSRAQVNQDLHEGLKRVEELVGDEYRPHGVVAGFLSSDNLRYLAEEEGIHVAQGTIWSQYGVDNGDGDGSLCYPYYPSLEHACKPAQSANDLIDCVNLDGWTCDFLCARRFGFEDGANSRLGVGPIESYHNLGAERGLEEALAVTRSHLGDNFERNGFGWVTVCWELSLVNELKPDVTDSLTAWLKETRREFPDLMVPLMSEFGEAWRREHKDNSSLSYRFVQRGTGVEGARSEPNLEIDWRMNRRFRLALLRDCDKPESEPLVLDLTRYDLPAQEPSDSSFDRPQRNWSLINRINQKRLRPEDKSIPFSQLTAEEQDLIKLEAPDLFLN